MESAVRIINQMEKNDSYKEPVLSYFSLNRLKAHCHYPPVLVDFSNPVPRPTSNSVFPVYNNDLCHFTPAFLLPSQKSYSEGYLTSEQGKFADKMRTEEEQLDCSVSKESVICLRGSQIKYCQVCKVRFEHYWEHIENNIHRSKVSKNEFNKDIAELCKRYQPQLIGVLSTPETSSRRSRKNKKYKQQKDNPTGCQSEANLASGGRQMQMDRSVPVCNQ